MRLSLIVIIVLSLFSLLLIGYSCSEEPTTSKPDSSSSTTILSSQPSSNPSDESSNTSSSAIESIAPKITSAEPAEAALNVATDLSQIRITFDLAMDTTVGTATLSGGLGNLGDGVWSNGDKTLTFPITEALDSATNYSLTLTGYTSAEGKNLDTLAYLIDGVLNFRTISNVNIGEDCTHADDGLDSQNPYTVTPDSNEAIDRPSCMLGKVYWLKYTKVGTHTSSIKITLSEASDLAVVVGSCADMDVRYCDAMKTESTFVEIGDVNEAYIVIGSRSTSQTITVEENKIYTVTEGTRGAATFDSIRATGTKLGANADSCIPSSSLGYDLPFDIYVYGQVISQGTTVFPNANGLLYLEECETAGVIWGECAPDYSSNMMPMIAAFHDDITAAQLIASGGGGFWVEVIGTSPNRELTMEWYAFHHDVEAETVHVQLIFFENNPYDFKIIYGEMHDDADQPDRYFSQSVVYDEEHYMSYYCGPTVPKPSELSNTEWTWDWDE